MRQRLFWLQIIFYSLTRYRQCISDVYCDAERPEAVSLLPESGSFNRSLPRSHIDHLPAKIRVSALLPITFTSTTL